MKRCPTCDKTFDDNLKFCQTDGTPLVDDAAEPVDPYKTMVGNKEDIAAAMASLRSEGSSHDEQVLDLPGPMDANKTQIVSEAEIRAGMERNREPDEQVIDVPPIGDQQPEPPRFNEPNPEPPSFGQEPPASPFSTPASDQAADRFSQTTPPIPSPFGEAKPPSMEPSTPFEHSYSEPAEPAAETPQFADPEPIVNTSFGEPSAPASEPLAQQAWTPPQESNMQNPQEFGQNVPPASAAVEGANKTLPIVSLVAGILSLCCYISPLTGIVALITGFLGMKNVNNDPAQYGGKTFAIIGMILGGLFFLIGVVYWVFILFLGGMEMMMRMANQ
jgi:uncharacterized membrane protein